MSRRYKGPTVILRGNRIEGAYWNARSRPERPTAEIVARYESRRRELERYRYQEGALTSAPSGERTRR